MGNVPSPFVYVATMVAGTCPPLVCNTIMTTLTFLEDAQAEVLAGGRGFSNNVLVVGIDYTNINQNYKQKNVLINTVVTPLSKNSFTAASFDIVQFNTIG